MMEDVGMQDVHFNEVSKHKSVRIDAHWSAVCFSKFCVSIWRLTNMMDIIIAFLATILILKLKLKNSVSCPSLREFTIYIYFK